MSSIEEIQRAIDAAANVKVAQLLKERVAEFREKIITDINMSTPPIKGTPMVLTYLPFTDARINLVSTDPDGQPREFCIKILMDCYGRLSYEISEDATDILAMKEQLGRVITDEDADGQLEYLPRGFINLFINNNGETRGMVDIFNGNGGEAITYRAGIHDILIEDEREVFEAAREAFEVKRVAFEAKCVAERTAFVAECMMTREALTAERAAFEEFKTTKTAELDQIITEKVRENNEAAATAAREFELMHSAIDLKREELKTIQREQEEKLARDYMRITSLERMNRATMVELNKLIAESACYKKVERLHDYILRVQEVLARIDITGYPKLPGESSAALDELITEFYEDLNPEPYANLSDSGESGH